MDSKVKNLEIKFEMKSIGEVYRLETKHDRNLILKIKNPQDPNQGSRESIGIVIKVI